MKISDFQVIPQEVVVASTLQLGKNIEYYKDKLRQESDSGKELIVWRTQKSCPICRKIYSQKADRLYCPKHPEQGRSAQTLKMETRLFRFIVEAVMAKNRCGINVYSTIPNTGEKIKTQRSYSLPELEMPHAGARVVIGVARSIMRQAGKNEDSIFKMVTLPNQSRTIPHLVDGADFTQAASVIVAAIDDLLRGSRVMANSVLFQLISAYELIENALEPVEINGK